MITSQILCDFLIVVFSFLLSASSFIDAGKDRGNQIAAWRFSGDDGDPMPHHSDHFWIMLAIGFIIWAIPLLTIFLHSMRGL